MQEQAAHRDRPFAADMPAAGMRVADKQAVDIQAAGKQAVPAGAEPDKDKLLSADKAARAEPVPVRRAGPVWAVDQA